MKYLENNMNNISFNGKLSTELCKKLGVATNTQIPGAKTLTLTDIKSEPVYNRYKNGIFYKAKSFRDYMESQTFAEFSNDINPEKQIRINIGSNLDINSSILEKINDDVIKKASKLLDIDI